MRCLLFALLLLVSSQLKAQDSEFINQRVHYVCHRCYGSGRVAPNRYGGPDECVGICGLCRGSGKGNKKVLCSKRQLKKKQDRIISNQQAKYTRREEAERRYKFEMYRRRIENLRTLERLTK